MFGHIVMDVEGGLPCRGEDESDHGGPVGVFDELRPLDVVGVGAEAERAQLLMGVPAEDGKG